MAAASDFSDLGGTPVHDYSDLGGVMAQNSVSQTPTTSQSTPFYQQILPDAASGILNAGQAANRFLTRAVNGALGTNLSTAPQYNWGQTLGAGNSLPDQMIQGAAGYLPVAPLAEAAPVAEGLGAMEAPIAAKAAQYLSQSPRLANTLSQIMPNALFGATQSNDPVMGAAQGAGLGAVATGLPSAIGAGWSKLSNAINPGQLMNQFLGKIGSGLSLTDNAKSLASDIQNAYQSQKAKASDLYNPIFNNYSGSNIFDGVKNAENTASSYLNLSPKITENYTPDLNDMHEAFLQNPTLQNAHNLQSQLGSSVRDFQGMAAKGNLTTADRINMQNYQRAQNSVLTDTNNFLERQQPGLGAQYTAANTNYAANVAPYLSNPQISQIAQGNINYPKNINTIFAKPSLSVQKIVQDIGPQANDKILYNQLGTPQNSATPEKLQAALGNLDKQGLSGYLTPDHLDFQTALTQKIANRNVAQHVAGMAAGAIAAHPLGEGASGAAEIVGGLIGNTVVPPVIRGLQKIIPTQRIGNVASNVSKIIYPPLRNAAIGSYFQPPAYPLGGLGAPIPPN